MSKDSMRLELDPKGNIKKYNMTIEEIKTLTEKKNADSARLIADSMKNKDCDN